MVGNAQLADFWNGAGGRRWVKISDKMQGMLARVTPALIQFAAPRPGECVLDLGCGCGATSLTLARAVGPTGRVTGLDISRPQLEVARERAREAGLSVQFVEADVSTTDFKPESDLAFSHFGTMFFTNPVRAFANIRKGLKPGGRLAFVCWRSLLENTWLVEPLAAARDLLGATQSVPFLSNDDRQLVMTLEQAGYQSARADKLDTVMHMGATLEEAVELSLAVGPLSLPAATMAGALRDRVKDRVRGAVARYGTPAGVRLPAACWLVSARA